MGEFLYPLFIFAAASFIAGFRIAHQRGPNGARVRPWINPDKSLENRSHQRSWRFHQAD